MSLYRRVVPVNVSEAAKVVWNTGENGLIGHMTSTGTAMTVDDALEAANEYVEQYKEDFEPGFKFDQVSVTNALEALADAGFEERVSAPEDSNKLAAKLWADGKTFSRPPWPPSYGAVCVKTARNEIRDLAIAKAVEYEVRGADYDVARADALRVFAQMLVESI